MKGYKCTYAVCIIKPEGDSGVSGVVRLVQPEGCKTRVLGDVDGLQKGYYGFYIH